MLILTRRPGEAFVIDGDIRVTVISSSMGRVRLGIDAPDHVIVDRLEVHRDKLARGSRRTVPATNPTQQER